MNSKTHNPDSITRPASNYVQGVSVTDATHWLHISGQVGANPDGSLAGDIHAQMRRCFENILAVLEDADMSTRNLVKITAFITNADDTSLCFVKYATKSSTDTCARRPCW